MVHDMDCIIIYKRETLLLLQYELVLFPPIIPDNYIIFQNNRVLNFHDKNIFAEIRNKKKSIKHILTLFNELLLALDGLKLKYRIVPQLEKIKNKIVYNKIDASTIKMFIRKRVVWAINDRNILQLPNNITNMINSVTDFGNMKDLIKRSFVVRNFLLNHNV